MIKFFVQTALSFCCPTLLDYYTLDVFFIGIIFFFHSCFVSLKNVVFSLTADFGVALLDPDTFWF